MRMNLAGLQRFHAVANPITEDLYGGVISINGGAALAASVSHPTEGGSLGLGVESLEAILKVRIRKALYATKPVHDVDLITYNGEKWRVDDVTDDRASATWYLTCLPANVV
jgi:hypothetical protein